MLDNTLFLFAIHHPDGEIVENYRQVMYKEGGEQYFIYITIARRPYGKTEIYTSNTYEELVEFMNGEFEDQTSVFERAIEEAQL